MNKRMLFWLGLWALALIGAFSLDQSVAQWLHSHGFHDPKAGLVKGTHWAYVIKMIGSFQAVIILAAALVAANQFTWRQAATLLCCAATAIVTEPLKWIAGRARPVDDAGMLTSAMSFVPFTTRDPANSFPSGHAMIAFATAACLARYYPRWRPLFYGVATLVAIERILELAHYVSDVVAAIGIGIALSYVCMGALTRFAAPAQLPAQGEGRARDAREARVEQPQLEPVEEGST